MHIHGGGQRASLERGEDARRAGLRGALGELGRRGTASAFNSEGAQPGDPNTDWGAVDPTQLNVQGYFSMLPGPKQFFEDREHPKNNNWYLLTLGCRRGLTFLEQQPEVDAQRLGMHGYSMGGNLTMYVAGTDARVKAAVPGVGGQGWRWQPHAFIGGMAQQEHIKGDVEVVPPHAELRELRAAHPLPGAAPQRHERFPRLDGRRVSHQRAHPGPARAPLRGRRISTTASRPRSPSTMPLWFDHFLKGGPALPETPESELVLKTGDGVPMLRVTPEGERWPVARCEIYYSVDPDPRARFWRSAEVEREGDVFTAQLPLHTLDLPLFAFANVYHTLPQPESLRHLPGYAEPITRGMPEHPAARATVTQLRSAGVRSDRPATLIDDFAHGWRDWYRLNVGHRDLWQNWTRKITDPKWRGPDGAKLAVTLKLPKPTASRSWSSKTSGAATAAREKLLFARKRSPARPANRPCRSSAADFQHRRRFAVEVVEPA